MNGDGSTQDRFTPGSGTAKIRRARKPDITDDMDDEQLTAHKKAMESDPQYREAVYYERN